MQMTANAYTKRFIMKTRPGWNKSGFPDKIHILHQCALQRVWTPRVKDISVSNNRLNGSQHAVIIRQLSIDPKKKMA